jgi:alpha,alpha-trehalase
VPPRDIDRAAVQRLAAVDVDAVIFDTDGVLTRTATVHAAAWKLLFDDVLRHRAGPGRPFAEFTEDDYRRYVDGMPRYDGVRRFLESRGIDLPPGSPSDPPGDDSVCALGNRKNEAFLAELETHGVEPFATTIALLGQLRAAGIATAAISASENCGPVVERAGIADLLEVRVDGLDAKALALAGKPDPAVFLEAARRLGVAPARAAVVEDALAGVEAGRRGGFALVLGVARAGDPEEMLAAGADVVFADLGEVQVDPQGRWSFVGGTGP